MPAFILRGVLGGPGTSFCPVVCGRTQGRAPKGRQAGVGWGKLLFPKQRLFRQGGMPGRRCARRVSGEGGGGDDEAEEVAGAGAGGVNAILQRKQQEIGRKLEELGERGLDELFSAAQPAEHGRSFFQAMQVAESQDKCLVMADVYPTSPSMTSDEMGELAAKYESWGCGALTVWTDLEVSSHGIEDLQYVVSKTTVPVLRRDWIIHPLQIAETAEVGAAGLTVINTITGQGTPMLYAFAARLGLDVPVEVCNLKDVEASRSFKIPVYGVNMTVGLALGGLPGFRTSMLNSILSSLPPEAKSVVGVNSVEEAKAAKDAGALCLNISYAALAGAGDPEALIKEVCAVSRGGG